MGSLRLRTAPVLLYASLYLQCTHGHGKRPKWVHQTMLLTDFKIANVRIYAAYRPFRGIDAVSPQRPVLLRLFYTA